MCMRVSECDTIFFEEVYALFFNNDECNFYVKINQQILTILTHELFPDFCFIILKQLNTK